VFTYSLNFENRGWSGSPEGIPASDSPTTAGCRTGPDGFLLWRRALLLLRTRPENMATSRSTPLREHGHHSIAAGLRDVSYEPFTRSLDLLRSAHHRDHRDFESALRLWPMLKVRSAGASRWTPPSCADVQIRYPLPLPPSRAARAACQQVLVAAGPSVGVQGLCLRAISGGGLPAPAGDRTVYPGGRCFVRGTKWICRGPVPGIAAAAGRAGRRGGDRIRAGAYCRPGGSSRLRRRGPRPEDETESGDAGGSGDETAPEAAGDRR